MGETDGICDLTYGKAYANAFPNARFEPIPNAGHFPQLEKLEQTAKRITAFAEATAD